MSHADTIELTLAEMVHGGERARTPSRPPDLRAVRDPRRAHPRADRGRSRALRLRAGRHAARAIARAGAPDLPGRCGGCAFQHIAYEAQADFKRDVVIDQLKRLGNVRNPVVLPTIPARTRGRTATPPPFRSMARGGCAMRNGWPLADPDRECRIIRPELVELIFEWPSSEIPGAGAPCAYKPVGRCGDGGPQHEERRSARARSRPARVDQLPVERQRT